MIISEGVEHNFSDMQMEDLIYLHFDKTIDQSNCREGEKSNL